MKLIANISQSSETSMNTPQKKTILKADRYERSFDNLSSKQARKARLSFKRR